MSEHKTLVEVQHLQQYFPAGGVGKNRKYVQAVDDVSFAIRKGETLLIVLVACQLDAVIGGSFVRDAAIIGFSANEAISIVENAGLMGLPIPAAITKAIDILKQRAETPEKGKN